MFTDINSSVGWWAVFVVAAFMPLTAVSFFLLRRREKQKKYNGVLSKLGLDDSNVSFLAPKFEDEFRARDYVLPVSFVTVICFLGGMMMFFGLDEDFDFFGSGRSLREALLTKPNFILAGSLDPDTPLKLMFQNQHRALAMGVWAFLGAFIWSAQYILHRMIADDLHPGTYLRIGIRLFLASFLSVAIYHLIANSPDVLSGTKVGALGQSGNLWPPLGFVIGMFPQRWLLFLIEKIERVYRLEPARASVLPLEMIQGMTSFHRVRLNEVGIDNAQNLAKSHVVELLLKTPFKPYQVIDWMGQAMLHVYFRDELKTLRDAGIRDILVLLNTRGDKAALERELMAQAGQGEAVLRRDRSTIHMHREKVREFYRDEGKTDLPTAKSR